MKYQLAQFFCMTKYGRICRIFFWGQGHSWVIIIDFDSFLLPRGQYNNPEVFSVVELYEWYRFSFL
jgi:hypothetical protein